MLKKKNVVISLGSNTADSKNRVKIALRWLASAIGDLKQSEIYSTTPNSGTGADYSNCIIKGNTAIGLHELNHLLKKYEIEQGRDKNARNCGIVPIDIDILLYDTQILRPKELTYPYLQPGLKELDISPASLQIDF